jgi:hypothetical protein
LLLELEKPDVTKPCQNQKYEVMWERDPSLLAAIEEAWAASPTCSNLGDLVGKISYGNKREVRKQRKKRGKSLPS